jgi:hypothetical protein
LHYQRVANCLAGSMLGSGNYLFSKPEIPGPISLVDRGPNLGNSSSANGAGRSLDGKGILTTRPGRPGYCRTNALPIHQMQWILNLPSEAQNGLAYASRRNNLGNRSLPKNEKIRCSDRFAQTSAWLSPDELRMRIHWRPDRRSV